MNAGVRITSGVPARFIIEEDALNSSKQLCGIFFTSEPARETA